MSRSFRCWGSECACTGLVQKPYHPYLRGSCTGAMTLVGDPRRLGATTARTRRSLSPSTTLTFKLANRGGGRIGREKLQRVTKRILLDYCDIFLHGCDTTCKITRAAARAAKAHEDVRRLLRLPSLLVEPALTFLRKRCDDHVALQLERSVANGVLLARASDVVLIHVRQSSIVRISANSKA